MIKEYTLGDDTGNLKLRVTVGTPGIANTVVFKFKEGLPKVLIAESNVDSGNVTERVVGSCVDFKSTRVKTRTIIDFGAIPAAQWQQLAENVVMNLKLSGGFSGTETFDYDEEDKTISNSGRVVVIDVEVNLI